MVNLIFSRAEIAAIAATISSHASDAVDEAMMLLKALGMSIIKAIDAIMALFKAKAREAKAPVEKGAHTDEAITTDDALVTDDAVSSDTSSTASSVSEDDIVDADSALLEEEPQVENNRTEVGIDAHANGNDTTSASTGANPETEAEAQPSATPAGFAPPRSVVDQYVGSCNNETCALYGRIMNQVEHAITWRDANAYDSITRVVKAMVTYNEAVGYRAELIHAADHLLQGSFNDKVREDQAFRSLLTMYGY